MKQHGVLFVCLVSVLIGRIAPAADAYRVTDEIRRADPPKFGANFTLNNFSPWSPQYQNIWNTSYANEPIVLRWTFQATGGGADYIENKQGEFKGLDPQLHRHARTSGAGFWQVFSDGFWDGAQVDVYRAVDGQLEHIRRDRVKSFLSPSREATKASPDQEFPEKIILEGTGEPIQRGDVYDLLMVRDEVPEQVASERSRRAFFRPMKETEVQWRIDSETYAPENGSTASMRVELPGGSDPVGMQQQYLRWEGHEVNYDVSEEYQLDVWLKADFDEPVIIQIGDRGTHEVRVPDEWKKFTFELDNSRPITEKVGWFEIKSSAEGTLWIDNMAVYQSDLEPFQILPEWVTALKNYQPGLIRDQGGRSLLTMDNFLINNQFQRYYTWKESGPSESNHQGGMTLPELLMLCKETGASPYIMSYMLWTDEEIDLLMEYLGGPESTPGGKLRAEHGQPQPWTEVLDKIYIECANEMWNRNFVPQAFPNQPELCGMISDRLFRAMRESEYAHPCFEYVASAFVYSIYRDTAEYAHRGWTYRNMTTCAENATVVATAAGGYIGGWDGATPIGQSDEELFQSNLLYPARFFEPKQESIEKLQEVMSEEYDAPQYEYIKYEAGPGYSLPSPEKPFSEQEEMVGKSYALGTATLDNFMFVLANNGNQNYYKFERGNNWASHNMHMIPHNTMLALRLRTYCEGDLMEVAPQSLDTVDWPEVQTVGLDNHGNRSEGRLPAISDLPMTRAYAFRDGDRWSFLLLNRDAKQAREITLDLPYKPRDAYRRILYDADDIRATNRGVTDPANMNIRITESEETGFRDGFTVSVPPGGAMALMNREAAD